MGYFAIIKAFIISLFLSSSWSYLGRQSNGIWAIILQLIKPDKRDNVKAMLVERNAFNTNPYCTGVMIGIALNDENQIKQESFVTLQSIFGSIGDEYIWRTLRPTLLSISVLVLLIGYLWIKNIYAVSAFSLTPLMFLIPYNIAVQGIRIKGIYQGKKIGVMAAVKLVEYLRRPITKFYNLLAFVMGMIVVIIPLVYLSSFAEHIKSFTESVAAFFTILGVVIVSYFLMRSERSSSYLLIAGLLIFLLIKVL